MALIQVTVIEDVLTNQQKREIVERLTDAMVEVKGESMRRTIWCIDEEVASGDWRVGGRPAPRHTRPEFGPQLLDPDGLGDHMDRLYRAVWALCGSRQDAEDLVQETFLNVLKRGRLLRDGNEIGYLERCLNPTSDQSSER